MKRVVYVTASAVYTQRTKKILTMMRSPASICTVRPTRYRTRHLFNNSSTNEDIARVLSLCEK